MKTQSKGFTLIELIIGITILSLLAVALLAALDPVEQFNKARDTATRNTTMEIHNAMLRYKAAKEVYPTIINVSAAKHMSSAEGLSILTDLTDSGELKGNFASVAGTALQTIYVANDSTSNILYTCSQPRSKQFSQQGGLYNISAPGSVLPVEGTCTTPAASGTRVCYYCAR